MKDRQSTGSNNKNQHYAVVVCILMPCLNAFLWHAWSIATQQQDQQHKYSCIGLPDRLSSSSLAFCCMPNRSVLLLLPACADLLVVGPAVACMQHASNQRN